MTSYATAPRPYPFVPPARRSGTSRLTVAAVALVAALLVLAGLLYWTQLELQQGAADIQQAKALVRAGNLQQSPVTVLNEAAMDVGNAHTNFTRAGQVLSVLDPLLQHLGWVPLVGAELTQARYAARMAERTAAGVLAMLRGLQPALVGWDRSGARPRLPAVVAHLATQRGQFQRACVDFDEAHAARAAIGPAPASALRSAVQTFGREYRLLRALCSGLMLAPQLFGFDGPATYLVAYQNPAELRATGGYIGSYGLVTMRDGHMQERFSGTWAAISNLSVPPPQPMVQYNGEWGWLFMDSNWSPDFPTSAALERFFLKLNTGVAPPGVIDVTPAAAADVLAATGPIFVPEYGRWVSAANVAQLSDYYAHFEPVHPISPNESAAALDTQRKEFIGVVAKHLLARFDHLSASAMVRLAEELSTGIKRGDIQLNFTNPAEEAFARKLGAAGGIDRTTSDYLYVVDSNFSYNKINPWVSLSETYRATILPNRWVQSDLTLTFTDRAPASLAGHGTGPGDGALGGPLDYADFVRVYVPEGAELETQSGWTQPWEPGPAYDKTMFCGYLIVPNGQTRTVQLQYEIPPNIFQWSHGAQYRLVVQHQPGSDPVSFTAVVRHDGQTSSWTVSHPVESIRRTVDIQARPFQPIPLPSQPWPVVAPNHWIEPHTFLAAPYFQAGRP